MVCGSIAVVGLPPCARSSASKRILILQRWCFLVQRWCVLNCGLGTRITSLKEGVDYIVWQCCDYDPYHSVTATTAKTTMTIADLLLLLLLLPVPLPLPLQLLQLPLPLCPLPLPRPLPLPLARPTTTATPAAAAAAAAATTTTNSFMSESMSEAVRRVARSSLWAQGQETE